MPTGNGACNAEKDGCRKIRGQTLAVLTWIEKCLRRGTKASQYREQPSASPARAGQRNQRGPVEVWQCIEQALSSAQKKQAMAQKLECAKENLSLKLQTMASSAESLHNRLKKTQASAASHVSRLKLALAAVQTHQTQRRALDVQITEYEEKKLALKQRLREARTKLRAQQKAANTHAIRDTTKWEQQEAKSGTTPATSLLASVVACQSPSRPEQPSPPPRRKRQREARDNNQQGRTTSPKGGQHTVTVERLDL